jgi:hypothetical protein
MRSASVALVSTRNDSPVRSLRRMGNRSKGLLLLGAWLILSNLVPMLGLRIPNSGLLMTILAVVAGALILVDR